MRITVKIGLLFAAIWIAIKMIFFMTGLTGDSIQTSAMINILCLLLSISVGLYLVKLRATEETSLMTDIKNGMTSGVPYILVVSIFMYIFYAEINPEFISHLRAEKVQAMKTRLDDPATLARLKSENADFEVMSKEQIFERMKQGPENTINSKSTSVLNLFALLLLATMNSIFVAVIYRKVVFIPRS